MKILKYLFLLLLILLIGGAIYFGTKDGSYNLSDSMVIKAPVEVIFEQVNEFKKWKEWGPWKEEDPNRSYTYAEKTSGEGASFSWKGVVDGSMTTTRVIPNKEILQDLTLNTTTGERNPKVTWKFEKTEQGTKVTWSMKGEHELMDKVFQQYKKIDFDKNVHEMQQNGLNGLAAYVDAEMKKFTVNIDGVSQHGGGYYMYVTAASKISTIASKMGPMMGQVAGFMQQNNIQMSGQPFTIYNQVDAQSGNVIFSACIPVKEQIITDENSSVLCSYLAPVAAVKTTLKGDYTNLDAAYMQGQAYMAKNNLQAHPTVSMFEIYVTDPGMEANPANWITEVYMPIVSPNLQ